MDTVPNAFVITVRGWFVLWSAMIAMGCYRAMGLGVRQMFLRGDKSAV